MRRWGRDPVRQLEDSYTDCKGGVGLGDGVWTDTCVVVVFVLALAWLVLEGWCLLSCSVLFFEAGPLPKPETHQLR